MYYGPKGGKFVSARHKLARAKWIIHSLEEGANDWIEKNPASVVHGIDPADGVETVKLVAPMLPVEIPLSCGEALHHMRGALDHAVSAMVEHITRLQDRRVNFPFHETKQGFESLRTHAEVGKRHKLFTCAPEIWDKIEHSYKPYRSDGGNAHLWAINKLNNADKHRLLITTTSIVATRADLARVGHHGNLAVLIGPGEMVLGKGLNLGTESPSRMELILHEPSIMADTELFTFLKATHSLVFDIVHELEGLFFEPADA
ncbi:MAG: hypothetical protein U9R07_05940 [Pseudomonadota bacterium]|nr:hypothetical protein [Pseudomonadota bacterium]